MAEQTRVEELEKRYWQGYRYWPFGLGGALIGSVVFCGVGTIFGVGIGTIIWLCMNRDVKKHNEQIDRAILEEQARQKREQAELEAKRRQERLLAEQAERERQIQYRKNVEIAMQKALSSPENIAPMVDCTTAMFQRMVSHADAGSNIKFIEVELTFEVRTDRIRFSYQSKYWNPQDDFDFDKERIRFLDDPAKCEGLAAALAKLTVEKMESLYPKDSMNIETSRVGAIVTLRFKGANRNFIPSKPIL